MVEWSRWKARALYKPIEEAVCSVKDLITKFMGIREKPS